MLFMVHFEITPEHRDQSHERFKRTGEGLPPTAKHVAGPWLSVTLLEGWSVVEADDAVAVGQLMKHWTDLNINHVTPVLTAEDMAKVGS